MEEEIKEIKKNRALMFAMILFSLLILVAVYGIWLDIKPSSIELNLGNQLRYTNVSTVYMNMDIKTTFNTKYTSSSSEFMYCMYGKIYKDGYLINELKETKITATSGEGISYESCPRSGSYLGTIHSHPQPLYNRNLVATCVLSKQDLFTFGAEQQPLTGIICGVDKFGFYSKESLDASYQVAVIA